MNPNQILQRAGGIALTTVQLNLRIWRRLANDSLGLVQRLTNGGSAPKPEMDDVTLTRKVETVIFRGSNAPKSTVNVNVVDGVVWLRGEVKRPEQIRSLEAKARSVPEVKGVENLLHLPKTPASTRADAPRRQQRTRSSTRRPTPRREEPRGAITNDRTDELAPQAEPSPTEHAAEREGRTPAPFGSSESEPSGPGPGDSGA
jgi:BON domain